MRCLVPARQPQDTGAPNNQMFPNTPEVSQMVFSLLQKPVWLIWSCHKKYIHLFGCFRGTLIVTKVLGDFFVSSESVSFAFIGKLQGTFCPYTEIFRRPSLTIIPISWYQNVNNKTSKILVRLLENLRIFKTNGTVIHKFSAFLKLYKFQGNICSFEQLFYWKKSLGAPEDNYIEFMYFSLLYGEECFTGN